MSKRKPSFLPVVREVTFRGAKIIRIDGYVRLRHPNRPKGRYKGSHKKHRPA